MKRTILFFVAVILFASCQHTEKTSTAKPVVTVNNSWLDSVIKQHSDTQYTKPYKRSDFVTATSYISRKDSSELQVMKDSAGHIRQVIIAAKGKRTYFAQYYPNGQLIADLKFDAFGQYEGAAKYYYENGRVKSEGLYHNGFSVGDWNEYDEKGMKTITKFDSSGTRIN